MNATRILATLLAATLSWGSTLAFADTFSDHLSRSFTLEGEGKYDDALGALDGLGARGQDAYLLSLRQGWLHYLAGRYGDSVHAYREALDSAPRSVEAQLGLTLPLIASKRWTEVVAACDAALAEAPGTYLALSRRAFALYSLGRYHQAAQAYAAVLDLYPTDVEMRAGLGWALLKEGQGDDARAAFTQALRYAPDYQAAKEGLEASR